jgi:hypothetical protein
LRALQVLLMRHMGCRQQQQQQQQRQQLCQLQLSNLTAQGSQLLPHLTGQQQLQQPAAAYRAAAAAVLAPAVPAAQLAVQTQQLLQVLLHPTQSCPALLRQPA